MWVMERIEGTESRGYSGIQSELCGLWTELKVQRAGRIELYTLNCGAYGAS